MSQKAHPESSIAARKYGYICTCSLGAWCDGGCLMRRPPGRLVECLICKSSYIPDKTKCNCYKK